jgi:hypothetical protein
LYLCDFKNSGLGQAKRFVLGYFSRNLKLDFASFCPTHETCRERAAGRNRGSMEAICQSFAFQNGFVDPKFPFADFAQHRKAQPLPIL